MLFTNLAILAVLVVGIPLTAFLPPPYSEIASGILLVAAAVWFFRATRARRLATKRLREERIKSGKLEMERPW